MSARLEFEHYAKMKPIRPDDAGLAERAKRADSAFVKRLGVAARPAIASSVRAYLSRQDANGRRAAIHVLRNASSLPREAIDDLEREYCS